MGCFNNKHLLLYSVHDVFNYNSHSDIVVLIMDSGDVKLLISVFILLAVVWIQYSIVKNSYIDALKTPMCANSAQDGAKNTQDSVKTAQSR